MSVKHPIVEEEEAFIYLRERVKQWQAGNTQGMSESKGAPPADGGGVVASDQEIAEALGSLLRDCSNNNSFASLNDVVRQLQSKLDFDLSHKIDFIRNQIHSFILLQSQAPNFLSHQNQQKDHFALQHTPNFHPGPSAQPNFAVHHPENYGYRPAPHQPPPPPQQHQPSPPPPHAVVKTSNVAAASVATSGNPKESAPTGRKRRGGPGGLNKLCGVSPELQTIVGQPTLPRTEIVKQLWAYIRKNNLQDPNNKRKIICNEELRLVFETDCTDMFKMNKLLAKHIITLEPTKQTVQNSKKPKVDVESGSQNDDPVPIVIISEALANFFGSKERELSQAEVLRQIWEYIKVHQLELKICEKNWITWPKMEMQARKDCGLKRSEDPLNSVTIICDAKLQELLGCESISALEIPEMLAHRHLFKKS